MLAQEYILVENGHKDEVANRLATERHQSYSRKNLVDSCYHIA